MSEQQKQAVLIVDDQPNWRSLLSTILEEEYEITCAEGYKDALSAISHRRSPFAAAVIDIRLNDRDPANEDGLRLLKQLKGLDLPTNAIVLTGYPSIRTAKEALRNLQAVDYVLKYPEDGTSLDWRDLRRVVMRAVELFTAQCKDAPSTKTALIIEDEAHWQETLAEALDDYVVDRAMDFDAAMDKIQKHMYSLMIVDLKLGQCSPEEGMELLNTIRKFNEHAEVIVVSGYDTAERVRDAFARYRVCDFLMKRNFSLGNLRSAIRLAEEERATSKHALTVA